MLSSGKNTEKSNKTFLEKFESTWHLCLTKYISKNKLQFKDKPWLTRSLQKFTPNKNQFPSKFIKLKDPCKKGNPHKIQTIQKSFKSFINTIKKSKKKFPRCFQENIKNLKNMWIKKIVSWNNSNHVFPTAITVTV